MYATVSGQNGAYLIGPVPVGTSTVYRTDASEFPTMTDVVDGQTALVDPGPPC